MARRSKSPCAGVVWLRTRRLILIGSFFEARAAEDPELRARILRGLDGFLTKNRDRELFDLPQREQS